MKELFDPYKVKFTSFVGAFRYYYKFPDHEGLLFLCTQVDEDTSYIIPRYHKREWFRAFLERTGTVKAYEAIKKLGPEAAELDEIFVEQVDPIGRTLGEILFFKESPYYCEEPRVFFPEDTVTEDEEKS